MTGEEDHQKDLTAPSRESQCQRVSSISKQLSESTSSSTLILTMPASEGKAECFLKYLKMA